MVKSFGQKLPQKCGCPVVSGLRYSGRLRAPCSSQGRHGSELGAGIGKLLGVPARLSPSCLHSLLAFCPGKTIMLFKSHSVSHPWLSNINDGFKVIACRGKKSKHKVKQVERWSSGRDSLGDEGQRDCFWALLSHHRLFLSSSEPYVGTERATFTSFLYWQAESGLSFRTAASSTRASSIASTLNVWYWHRYFAGRQGRVCVCSTSLLTLRVHVCALKRSTWQLSYPLPLETHVPACLSCWGSCVHVSYLEQQLVK